MGDFDDEDDEGLVFDGVDDPIRSLTDAISILSGQLLTTRWAWIVSERLDPSDDSLADGLLGDRLDLPNRGWLDLNARSCHCASET